MKHSRQLIFSALSVCLALGVCGVATACGTNDDKKTTVDYSVTVTCDDSAVLAGIEVELTDANGLTAEGGAAKALTNGKATFAAAPGTYHVELSGVPEEDYTWEEATVSEAHPDVTIALTPVEKEENVAYTITIVNDKDEPVAGAEVQICTVGDAGSCYGGDTTLTDAQGKVTIEAPAATYEVHILSGLPEGYTYDNEVDGAKNLLTAEKTALTVKLAAEDSGDDEPTTVDYTVTVTCTDAAALEGIKAALKTEGGEDAEGGAAKELANGTATFTLAPGTYKVVLTGVPETFEWNTDSTVGAENTAATIALTAKEAPYALSAPFVGEHRIYIPATEGDAATSYVFYTYTATETGIYTLTYGSDYNRTDVNIAANAQHNLPIAIWNDATESYAFRLVEGTKYSFRFADGRAEAVGGYLTVTVTQKELTVPSTYMGTTWTDAAEDPKFTAVFTQETDGTTFTFNGKPVEFTIADRNAGFTFTAEGVNYTIVYNYNDQENQENIVLTWGDESAILYKPGEHPAITPGTEGNPLPLSQSDLAKSWTVETNQDGTFYTFEGTENTVYKVTVTGEQVLAITLKYGKITVVNEWRGATGDTREFRIEKGNTYSLNFAIKKSVDPESNGAIQGTVEFTIEEVKSTEIPDEILAIDWVCKEKPAVTIALTKTKVTLHNGFDFSYDVTSVATEEGKTVIHWGSSYTLTYDAEANTLTAVMGTNTFVFTPDEGSGTITLPTGWNGTYKSGDNVVVINGSTITITCNGYTDLSVTVTGYDETTETITFEANGVMGTIKNVWSWQKATSDAGVGALSITLNGTTWSLTKQA